MQSSNSGSNDGAELTFVLVHGAYHGAWCWKDVAKRLRSLKHNVYTPGHAILYQLAVAIFGGTTPFIATWLIHKFDSPLAPAVYTATIGLLGFIAV